MSDPHSEGRLTALHPLFSAGSDTTAAKPFRHDLSPDRLAALERPAGSEERYTVSGHCRCISANTRHRRQRIASQRDFPAGHTTANATRPVRVILSCSRSVGCPERRLVLLPALQPRPDRSLALWPLSAFPTPVRRGETDLRALAAWVQSHTAKTKPGRYSGRSSASHAAPSPCLARLAAGQYKSRKDVAIGWLSLAAGLSQSAAANRRRPALKFDALLPFYINTSSTATG
jgi:hypothetical protein